MLYFVQHKLLEHATRSARMPCVPVTAADMAPILHNSTRTVVLLLYACAATECLINQ